MTCSEKCVQENGALLIIHAVATAICVNEVSEAAGLGERLTSISEIGEFVMEGRWCVCVRGCLGRGGGSLRVCVCV